MQRILSISIAVSVTFLAGIGSARAQVRRHPVEPAPHSRPVAVKVDPTRAERVQAKQAQQAEHARVRREHAEQIHAEKMRRGAEQKRAVRVEKVGHPSAVVRAAGTEERPHLHAALAALQAAARSFQESPNGEAALGHLDTARHELDASAPADVYHGRRYDAIECTKHAIKLLRDSGKSGEAASLTETAIGHVEYCISAPRA